MAGPFGGFEELSAFLRELLLPGVAHVSAVPFVTGVAHIHLTYSDPVPLAARLKELDRYAPTIIVRTPPTGP